MSGSLTGNNQTNALRSIKGVLADFPGTKVDLNLEGVPYMDSSGIALLASLGRICREKDLSFGYHGESPQMREMISLVDLPALVESPCLEKTPKRTSTVVYVGEQTIHLFHNLRFLVLFVGEIAIALWGSLREPRRIRSGDLLRSLEVHGVNALPIITLINLLIGMVLAFQAAIQLRQFGANIFVANLVGLAQTREFGPMITAILLAGRSGSAFAAEIGSMKVNEEVDALETMNLDPIRFLVVPKILALLIALPLLTLYADLMGIAGGLIVGVLGLDLTVQGYLIQTQKAVGLFDVFTGITKTFAFALIIAGVGCLRGFQVKGGADSVGNAATSAVVSGIFLIILVDAIFTVIFQYV